MIPRTFYPKKSDFGGDLGGGGRRRPLDDLWAGKSEAKKGRVGERRPARAQDIGLAAPARMARQACRASACGATGRATSSPAWASVALVVLARQAHSVAPLCAQAQ